MTRADQMALPLEPPRPGLFPARNTDPQSSKDAAAEHVANGRRDIECEVVLEALRRFPGSTSRELAVDAERIGLQLLGQERDEWRYTLARRLPELEDAGLVRAVVHAASRNRPGRQVDPALRPCRVRSKRVIRWRPA